MVCTNVVAQSKKEQNALLKAQLDVAKAQQKSLQALWEIRANEVNALRNQVNKYSFPDVTKRYRACMDEVASLYGYVSNLNKLKVDVSDSVDVCQKFVKGVYGKCTQLMENQQVTGYYPPKMIFVPDTLNLIDKKRKVQNLLLQKQIEAYQAANASNTKKYEEMLETSESFAYLIDSCKKTDNVLSTYLVGLKEYRNSTATRIKLLQEDYFYHPKKYPAIYREVFGPASGEPPVFVDLEYMDEEPTFDMRGDFGNDFAPPPAEVVEERPRTNPEIHDIVEEQAEFPGGVSAMKEYIARNMKYPEVAKEMGISGKTYLRFVISDRGSISNVKVVKGLPDCPECDQEAIRIVKSMPNWKPARNNGNAVNSYYNLPVTFKAE